MRVLQSFQDILGFYLRKNKTQNLNKKLNELKRINFVKIVSAIPEINPKKMNG